jgi:1,4-dihydroxy-2-naphthoyl-CoA hydrolase
MSNSATPTIAPIWQQAVSVDILTRGSLNTAVSHLGIEFLEVGPDYLTARVPVDHRTYQPFGLLHGGVSVVLAETLGSCGAFYASPPGYLAVGLDINANHIKGVKTGWVTGVARPVHRGRSTHVWHIDMHNEAGELTCVSRITMSILSPRTA